MSDGPAGASTPVAVAVLRISTALVVLAVLGYAYGLRLAAGDGNPFDYFGYFTNQTSALLAVVLLASGATAIAGLRSSPAFDLVRGIATASLIVVGAIYNTLVPGTGSAPPWVSVLLHVVLPLLAVLDWALVPDRRRLRWSALPVVLVHPLVWLVVVLIRGRTDGWVPYGFLLPANGTPSLVLHVVGLSAAVLAAGAAVWALSRRASRPAARPRG
ncbi:Pr6Pr family membrane protein [Rathayibacter sp. ZW T2_19]|uniref:Pr6Pr family membrane protein n=1 Tax=Rathayibacter rubneri TaxID=2950106 RepID=A0A9X2ISG7_9MICO|nr:Pr6Pr family membrane protein [Rathayibacter rubneri]MCM6763405.1 Pr6Pr family membrane protein [Rathayibacter rubneri]